MIKNIKEEKIREFFNADVVDLKFFPDEKVRQKFTRKHKIDFSVIKNEVAKKEYKDLLVSVFCYEKPYSFNSSCFYYVLKLNKFMAETKGITTIPNEELKKKYIAYCIRNKLGKDIEKIILSCKEALLEMYDTRTGFDRDIWDRSIFSLTEERINKASTSVSFHFRTIENKKNRELVKLYIKHLLGDTEMSLSTIRCYFCVLSNYCDFLANTNILDVTPEGFNKFMDTKKDYSNYSFNSYINRIHSMYKYLSIKELLKVQNPVDKSQKRKCKQPEIENTVSEYVILQIFNNLHKAPFHYMLMYLINYCTGMRISDVCQLRTDCLFEDGDGGYYIRPYRCQKMRKPIMNLIPKSLFELIKEQIKVINDLPYDEFYLFPADRTKNMPYLSQTFRNNFKSLCNEWNIKNEDGSDYDYTTHSYRHTIASDLYQNYDVPLVTVQKAVLWHQEIQMSLSYVERPDEFKKMQEDKYISKCGESELSHWLKETLQEHILPNGVCGLSAKLGTCPALDACFSCPHFLTSKKFLHVHKNELAAIKSRLPIYEANGWIANIETAKRQIKELENIIQKLEEMEDEEDATISVTTTTT